MLRTLVTLICRKYPRCGDTRDRRARPDRAETTPPRQRRNPPRIRRRRRSRQTPAHRPERPLPARAASPSVDQPAPIARSGRAQSPRGHYQPTSSPRAQPRPSGQSDKAPSPLRPSSDTRRDRTRHGCPGAVLIEIVVAGTIRTHILASWLALDTLSRCATTDQNRLAPAREPFTAVARIVPVNLQASPLATD